MTTRPTPPLSGSAGEALEKVRAALKTAQAGFDCGAIEEHPGDDHYPTAEQRIRIAITLLPQLEAALAQLEASHGTLLRQVVELVEQKEAMLAGGEKGE